MTGWILIAVAAAILGIGLTLVNWNKSVRLSIVAVAIVLIIATVFTMYAATSGYTTQAGVIFGLQAFLLLKIIGILEAARSD